MIHFFSGTNCAHPFSARQSVFAIGKRAGKLTKVIAIQHPSIHPERRIKFAPLLQRAGNFSCLFLSYLSMQQIAFDRLLLDLLPH